MKAINLLAAFAPEQPSQLVPPWLRQRLWSALCWSWNGGHDLHVTHDDTRIYQRCHCGYETDGITIDRRDRRPHQ